jgi:hypothetical protein
MRKWMIVSLLMFFICSKGFGQQNQIGKSKVSTEKQKDVMLKDIFRGNIPANGYENTTELVLEHQKYYDIGAFTLSETSKSGTLTRKGQWTVIKGSAKDENATVVELDIAGNTEYFLRMKNGNLQKLDTALREIKPVGKNILVKQGK